VTISPLFWLAPVAALIALGFAWYFYRQMLNADEGNARMRAIAAHVRDGARAYLAQQYRVMGAVFAGLFAVFAVLAWGFGLQNPWLPFAFITGGFFSALAGYIGMKTATYASARTAQAATRALAPALQLAFRSGAVIGLVVVGLGLLNVSVWLLVLMLFHPAAGDGHQMIVVTTTLLTFGMGASLQALFARVAGGIFTKAADIGADIVGKIEAGIPEDDPRNPATIADNVGDNVGDVAGMGADLYESYTGSILAAAALGAAAFFTSHDPRLQFAAVVAPIVIAGAGILLSILGVYLVRTHEHATQKDLLGALSRGINLSAVLTVVAAALIIHALGLPNPWGLWGAVVAGLATGIVIGRSAEYYTSSSYRPTRFIAGQAATGAATVIIAGTAIGMISTAVPVTAVVAGTGLAFLFAAGFDMANVGMGLYGIGIAAVGMLSTLGITLASDAYGPIADNAGGNAEMSGLGAEVRSRTDALDALGNTTAATGKGFAIGSAALTALALLAAYIEVLRGALLQAGVAELPFADGSTVATANATLNDLVMYFNVTLLNPVVLLGIFLGAMTSFIFCGLAINAVGRAAGQMIDEVRRQFREIPGILTEDAEPDYARCVAIGTQGAQREMLLPALLAVLMPVATGIVFGVAGVMGLLVGALASGFVLAIYQSNAGGAWDNAKKYIEEGNLGGKGSDAHKASVIGDTVGDPFKDTSGPSLNILIKLMSMVAIVMAGVTLGLAMH
jgi:K(+)-stimulated pyrophosphate-energized sodium pump